jgi:hypothetical protein
MYSGDLPDWTGRDALRGGTTPNGSQDEKKDGSLLLSLHAIPQRSAHYLKSMSLQMSEKRRSPELSPLDDEPQVVAAVGQIYDRFGI